MKIPEQKNPPPMPKVKSPRKPSEKPHDPIVKKSKYPTKVGGTSDDEVNNIYKLAHEHIIDVIELYKGGIYDNFN